jgi:hypothetical protein
MKNPFTFICLLFSLGALAQVKPNKNGYVHSKITVQNPTYLTSVNISRYKGQDTFVVTQNTGGWLISIDSGIDAQHPLVFINGTGKKITVTNGLAMENCRHVKILGFGSDSAYGFEFVGVGGGVPGSIQGMENDITIEGCRFTHGGQGPLWIKEEAPHACDFYNYWHDKGVADSLKYGVISNYLAPNYQDSIWVRHCWIDSSGGDTYLGSTGTINGRDHVPCLNNTTPATMQAKNFHFDSNYVNYTGRSGVQLSLAVGGTNTIIGNIITNSGYEWPETHSSESQVQGAGVRTGSGDVNVEVAFNTVKYTNLWNYDIEEPDINFHDNFGDSCGYVIYHGSPYAGNQSLASANFSALDATTDPTIIKNNIMGYNTASNSPNGGGEQGTTLAVYGGSKFASSGNLACDNQQILRSGGSVSYINVYPTVLGTPFNYTDCDTSTCPGVYDTAINNSFAKAVQIPLDTDIFGTISSSTDKDLYKFNVVTAGNFTLTLTQLPADYDLVLYDSTQTLIKSSRKTGTTDEIIQRNLSVGLYYVKVIADSLNFNPTSCYKLLVSTSSFLKADYSNTKNDLMLNNNNVKLYPNPAHSSISLYLNKASTDNIIKISNEYGQIVLTKKVTNTQENLDVSKLSTGIYMISVFDKDGKKLYTDKFLKE